MAIQFTCPQCGSQTDVDDRFAGQTGPCRQCGAQVTIPGTPTQPFAATPPPRRSSSTPILLIALGCGGVALLFVIPILIALLLPAVQAAREAGRRAVCNNNLMQIGLAIQNYVDVNKAFPPGYVADASGRPMHSWRVLILPFLEQQALYNRYNFDEPWDGPNNSQLASLMPDCYRCPSDATNAPGGTTTAYAAIAGPGAMFDGATPTTFGMVRDGTSNTLLVVEASGAGIHWMEPRDLDVSQMTFQINASAADISSHHPGGAMAVFADGHTSFLQSSITAQVLKALISRDGGEPPSGGF